MTNPFPTASASGGGLRIILRRKLRHFCGPVWGERVFAFFQFWELVVAGFINIRCPVRATALAYTTLLALIPLIAIAASISTGILKSQGQAPIDKAIDMLVDQLTPKVDEAKLEKTNDTQAATVPGNASGSSTNAPVLTAEQKEKIKELTDSINRQKVAQEIKDSLNRVESGSLGATGMAGLIVVAIMLFSTIEATFNDIWGVTRGRSWVARIVQYWATVTLGPLIPIVVFSFNIGSELAFVNVWMQRIHLGFLSKFAIEQVAPLAVLSFGFAFFYQLMPNTKVRWTAAVVGGFTGGILWQLNSKLNVLFVSKVVTSAKIYGSLAMIPVFLFGLYLSWLILLFGAQVAYAFQNRVAYLQEKEAQRINFLGKEYLALRIMTFVGDRFNDLHAHPPGVIDIAQALRVSTRLVDDILKSMVAGGLVMETRNQETGFTLTRPLEKISCYDILMTLRTARGQTTEPVEDDARKAIDDIFEKVLLAEKSVSGRTSLRDLVDRKGLAAEPEAAENPGELKPAAAS